MSVPPSTKHPLQAFHNAQRGKCIVVAGCGPSVREHWSPPDVPIVGVNDAARYTRVDYLLTLDPPTSFRPDDKALGNRRAPIVDHRGPFFTSVAHYRKWLRVRDDVIYYSYVGVRGAVTHTGPTPFHDAHTGEPRLLIGASGGSPTAAISLAAFLGASRIGVIGVDLGEHHRFRHELPRANGIYAAYRDWLATLGVELVNLSATSALNVLPKVTVDEWLATTRCA